jgi:hypothetical protein
MTDTAHPVNPHPPCDSARLTQVDDRILRDLIVLHRAELAPAPRRQLAGVPALPLLESELRRRESSRLGATR